MGFQSGNFLDPVLQEINILRDCSSTSRHFDLNMMRSTRSAVVTTENDAAKPDEKRSRRTFGRDITNVAPEGGVGKSTSKDTKPHVFSEVSTSISTKEVASAASGPKLSSLDDDRDYMRRPADDIDARDSDNPLLCTDYVNRMYELFYEQEKTFKVVPDYLEKVQTHVTEKMRTILIDWMVEVHIKFKQVPETLYLTIQLIDRYLQLKPVRRSKLQLVGVACNLLASKYEEIYPPEVRDLVHITDHAYTKADIVEMENEVINTLKFDLTVPTIHTFLCRHLKAAHADRTMVQMSCYLAERSLQEYSMLKFAPSVIAATTVLLSRKSLNRQSPWSPTMLKYSHYDEKDLKECLDAFQLVLSDANNEGNQQQAVYRKYCSSKYGTVSKIPLVF